MKKRISFVPFLSQWRARAWLLLCLHPFGAWAQIDLGHGARWHGISNETVLQPGQTAFLCWGDDGAANVKEFTLSLFHVSGFKNNLSEPVVDERLLFYSAFCSGFEDQKFFCRDFALCPRTGRFRIEIKVSLGRNCPRQTRTTKIEFTVLPEYQVPIAIPSSLPTVCPNKPIELSVRSDLPQQNGAFWYDSLTSSAPPIYEGYAYSTTVPPGGTVTKFAAHFKSYLQEIKNYAVSPTSYSYVTCRISGTRVPVTAVGAHFNALPPPAPIFRAVCNKDPIAFQIENPLAAYDGVFWYDQPTGSAPIHDGFSYSRSFPNAYEVLYVAYYKRLGPDCMLLSAAKSAVTVVNVSQLVQNAVNQLPTGVPVNSYTITDYRDVNANLACDEPGQENTYWINLENADVLGDLSEFQQNLLAVMQTLPKPAGMSVNVSVQDAYWRSKHPQTGQYQTHQSYLERNFQKIVCADFIAPRGSTGSRTYERWSRVFVDLVYVDPLTGDTMGGRGIACQERLMGLVKVNTRHPQESPTEFCTNLTLTQVQSIAPIAGLSLGDCDHLELKSVCPGSVHTIGPNADQLRIMYVAGGGTLGVLGTPPVQQATWSPVDGLSNPAIIRPNLTADQVQTADSRYRQYNLRVRYADGVQAQHCTVIYKCEACGIKPTKTPVDEWLSTQ
ncbi:MAG TPA: hypothetical protein VFV37_09390 [Luteibaculaceae bacterium]|nr:hypothetical protein [Luteibaculaceae bacterium]